MIPKKLHYCWFGKNPLPKEAIKCIESWRKYCPDYEIICWNEEKFEVNSNNYTREAYQSKKWAFVTDYVRLYALYSEGGIYLDTDVEIKKNLDPFLMHKAFTGCENERYCVTGLMGAEVNHSWIKLLLDDYTNRYFINKDGSFDSTTNTSRITELTKLNFGWNDGKIISRLPEGVSIYPHEYFCAKDWRSGNIKVTKNTHSIHHFNGSWNTAEQKNEANRIKKMAKILGLRNAQILNSLIKKYF